MSKESPGPIFVKLNYLAPYEFENGLNLVYRSIDEFFTNIEEEFKSKLNGHHHDDKDLSRISFSLGNNYGTTSQNHAIGQYLHLSRFKDVPLGNVLEVKTENYTVFTFGKELNLEKIMKILGVVPKKKL